MMRASFHRVASAAASRLSVARSAASAHRGALERPSAGASPAVLVAVRWCSASTTDGGATAKPPNPPVDPPSTSGGTAGIPAAGAAAAAAAAAPATPPVEEPRAIRDMTPRQLMEELDKYIVGQRDAKKAVAVALRNRWRRHQCEPDMRDEINPKNILMIGPTGVGKTEIARRLAKLTDAPFVKVEATKFTEVGFHGRDVDTIIDDLLKAAQSQAKQVLQRKHEKDAKERAEERILQALAGSAAGFKEHLRSGALNHLEVTIELIEKPKEPPKSAGYGPDAQQMTLDIPAMMGLGGSKRPRTVRKTLKIGDAMPLVIQEELDKLVESANLQKEALRACEEDGIVVIDEIDKIVSPSGGAKSHQASAEGVQQDLLPIVEGTTVTTKSGVQVKTDKILFICSGAFHSVKPSDMLAELQGRLPIRVELKPLTKEDFYRIITEPKYNLLRQNIALMKTEGVDLIVTDDAKQEIARLANYVNSTVQNIGARRLITIIEKVMEEISFDAPERKGTTFTVDADYVRKSVDSLTQQLDLSKYLL
jgi:ATP-dependent HslUV protease ATP-binding subunit HslU